MAKRNPRQVVVVEEKDRIRVGATASQLHAFSEDVKYLWCPPSSSSSGDNNNIPILEHPPTALEFSRDYVSRSRPCIIRNALLLTDEENNNNSSRPLQLTLDDICDLVDPDETMLMVDVTPDGQGDCVRTTTTVSSQNQEVFVQPKECQMTLKDFRDRLRRQEQRNDGNNGNDDDLENNADIHLDIHQRPLVRLICEDDDDATTSSDDDDDSPPPLPENSVVYYSRQVRTDTKYSVCTCGCMDPPCIDYAYCMMCTVCIIDTANSHSHIYTPCSIIRLLFVPFIIIERLFTNRTSHGIARDTFDQSK
jgi:hypothetical protein